MPLVWPAAPPRFPIEVTSPLSPADICKRLAAATDPRGPSEQRVLEIRAYSPAPALGIRPLPERDFLNLMTADEKGFRFQYIFNRANYDILGKVAPAESGSRITISVGGNSRIGYLVLALIAAFCGAIAIAAHT